MTKRLEESPNNIPVTSELKWDNMSNNNFPFFKKHSSYTLQNKCFAVLLGLMCLTPFFLFAGDPGHSGRFPGKEINTKVFFLVNNEGLDCNDTKSHSRSGVLIHLACSHQGVRSGILTAGSVSDPCPPNPPTNATSSGNQTICAYQGATLQASGSGTITWYSSPSSTTILGTGSTFVTPTLSAGNYSYYAEAQTCSPSLSRTEITLTVYALPVVSVNSGSICMGQNFTLTPTGASSYSYLSGSGIVSPSATSQYSVVGYSSVGCVSSNTAVATVSVEQNPVISVNSGSICSGRTFTIIPTGAVSYTISGGSNTVMPMSNASYSVIGSSSAGCLSNMAISSVTVAQSPVITVADPIFCAGQTPTLIGTGAASYSFTNVIPPYPYRLVVGYSAEGCPSGPVLIRLIEIPLPVVSLSGGTICAGGSFTFSPFGAYTYTYSSGTGIVSPTTTTTYSMVGSTAEGCVSSNTAVVTVSVIPSPVVSVNSGSICSGSSFTLSPAGAVSYTISGGASVVSPTANTSYSVTGTSSAGCSSSDPTVATVTVHSLPIVSVNSGTVCAGQVFTIVPSGATSYVISGGSNTFIPTSNSSYSVTGTSSVGCISSNTAISSVVVLALPVLTIVGTPAICSGDSVTLTAAGADTYLWSNNASTSNIVVSPSSNTIYSVTGTDINGCQNMTTQSLTVNSLPAVTASASSTVICFGDSITLNGGGALSYLWSGGIADNTPFLPLLTNNYTVTGTDTNGCSNTAAVQVTVNALPLVTALASSTAVCSGASVTINATGANTYQWTGGIINNTAFFPNSSALYIVTGKDLNGCEDTASIKIIVFPLPAVSVTVTGVICQGESSILTAEGADVFLWSTGAQSNSVTVSPPTTTNYTVTGTDTNGCSKSIVVTQQVEACLGLETLSSSVDLQIFPNPNAGIFTIRTNSSTQVEIYNDLGQIVRKVQTGNQVTQIDITGFTKGIYRVIAYNATRREKLNMIVTNY